MLFVGLAFLGLVVLAACAIKVFVALRVLGKEIERTRATLEPRRVALRDTVERLDRVRE